MAVTVQMPPLHDAQREAMIASDGKRFVVMVCGRRWGKTSYAVLQILAHALQGELCWWVAPTLAQSRIAERMLRRLVKSIPKGICTEKRSEHLFNFATGGSIFFKTADDPDNLRGEGLQFVVIDEADFIGEEIWTDIIRPALSDKRGKALLCSTPRIENGWFHKLFIRGTGNDQQYVSLSYPSWTNNTIDPKEFDDVRRDLPTLVFRREFGAEFVSAAGTRVQRTWIKYGIPAAFKKISLGCDLAISEKEDADYSAFVITAVDMANKLWVIHAERDRLSFNAIMNKIKQLATDFGVHRVNIESVQFQASVVQELVRTTDLPVFKSYADKSKLSRFQVVEVKYENLLMHHVLGLPKEFEEEITSFPLADHDDFADALGYSVRGLMAIDVDEDDEAYDDAFVTERLDDDGSPSGEPERFQRGFG